MAAEEFQDLSDEQLDAEIAALEGPAEVDVDAMSDDELDAAIAAQEADLIANPEDPAGPSVGSALLTNIEEGGTLGLRSELSGVGTGIGRGIESVMNARAGGEGILDSLSTFKSAFSAGYEEGSEESEQELQESMEAQPVASVAGQLAGGLLTLPATGLASLKAANVAGKAFGAVDKIQKGSKVANLLEASTSGAIQAAGVSKKGYDDLGGLTADSATGAAASALLTGAAMAAFPAIKAGAGLIGRGGKKVLKKLSSATTGVAEKEIEILARDADEVIEMVKRNPEGANSMADEISEEINEAIKNTKKSQNRTISKTLKGDAGKPKVNGESILEEGELVLSEMDPVFDRDAIKKIREVMEDDVFASLADDGTMTVQRMNNLKRKLQDIASSTYKRDGILRKALGEEAEKVGVAVKAMARKARRIVDAAAPEVQVANAKLTALYEVADSMNKAILKEGKALTPLVRAGKGLSGNEAKTLKRIDEITGMNSLQKAEQLAAARTFYGEGGILPNGSQTGFAIARIGLGGVLGGATGLLSESSPTQAAMIGMALSSPLTLRTAIILGRKLKAPQVVSADTLTKMAQRYGLTTDGFEALVDLEIQQSPDKDMAYVEIPQENRELIEKDIKRSDASVIEKAKRVNELRRSGRIIVEPMFKSEKAKKKGSIPSRLKTPKKPKITAKEIADRVRLKRDF